MWFDAWDWFGLFSGSCRDNCRMKFAFGLKRGKVC